MSVLITGITGQDGSYLAEQLALAGERITGTVLRGEELPGYIKALQDAGSLSLVACDLREPASFRQVLREIKPKRVFHLAAISRPLDCERDVTGSRNINVTSVEVLLEWMKRESPVTRALVVSSSWVFGKGTGKPMDEQTPSDPLTEYAKQKQQLREQATLARQDGIFAACAIPFNHESERRSEEFVFAKVCRAAARIKKREQDSLVLGDMQVRRDWGYAPEYVTAFAWMLDVAEPHELVLATGEDHSVSELVVAAFSHLGLDHTKYVTSDVAVTGGMPPVSQCGDAGLAWDELGWEANVKFSELVKLLVDAGLDRKLT